MKWLVKTKAGRFTLIGISSVAILAFIGWELFLPKYGHASVAEIEAALPPNLGLEPKVDEATRVVLATAIYRHEHQGSLPPSLTDLIPRVLVGLPVDPFTGESMHYSASKQLVWSVSKGMVEPDETISYAFWPSHGYSVDLSVIRN